MLAIVEVQHLNSEPGDSTIRRHIIKQAKKRTYESSSERILLWSKQRKLKTQECNKQSYELVAGFEATATRVTAGLGPENPAGTVDPPLVRGISFGGRSSRESVLSDLWPSSDSSLTESLFY